MTENWWDRAACKGMIFTSHSGRKVPFDDASPQQAARVCDTCPVRAECRQAARVEERGMPLKLRHTVRGGMGPGERYREDRGVCGFCEKPCASNKVLCPDCLSEKMSDTHLPDFVITPEWTHVCITCGGRFEELTGEVCGFCAQRAGHWRLAS